ncbi:MAG TPA: type II toxin-antitoxin system Phd/YefM family antitoxin [Candidatus Dormibacteraeota bacterium]|nr:type II toxin-antitoxin system Phd/YefM family antitoxin [Candidatus Dormibacteraeota bacterium]
MMLDNMTSPSRPSRPNEPSRTFSAAAAKNRFAEVLDAADGGETVVITHYGATRAVVISAERYRALTQQPERELDLLTERFDAMLAAMQTDGAKAAMRAAFNASPSELGRAAVAGARLRRRTRRVA